MLGLTGSFPSRVVGLRLPWSVPAGLLGDFALAAKPWNPCHTVKTESWQDLLRHGPTGYCSDGSVTVEILIYVCQVLTKGPAVGFAATFPEDLGASFAPVAHVETCCCSLLLHRGA